MVPGVCAGKMWAAQLCRRPWTMLVELVLTAAPSFKMGLASNPTQWWLTAPMLPTATTRGRARPSRPVISLALPSLSPLTQVISEKNSSKFFMNFFLVHFQLILITFLADFAGQSGCTYPATPRYNFSCRNLKNTIFFKLLICEPKKSVFLGLVCFSPLLLFQCCRDQWHTQQQLTHNPRVITTHPRLINRQPHPKHTHHRDRDWWCLWEPWPLRDWPWWKWCKQDELFSLANNCFGLCPSFALRAWS